jgi:hypothetical protein
MADAHDCNSYDCVCDHIDNSVVTDANPIRILTDQLFAAVRPRVVGETADGQEDSVRLLARTRLNSYCAVGVNSSV